MNTDLTVIRPANGCDVVAQVRGGKIRFRGLGAPGGESENPLVMWDKIKRSAEVTQADFLKWAYAQLDGPSNPKSEISQS